MILVKKLSVISVLVVLSCASSCVIAYLTEHFVQNMNRRERLSEIEYSLYEHRVLNGCN